ncbi:zinc finger CCHC domain-containing protein 9 [Hemicordylus capensis]|uniref:zinc finger CCHC domain-containing protein 9 n=1 Tax=Hemicordylus capensis TaxID=884348 RepID=UPI0023020F5A|nr:zinc finger CCHC domain-containing protein 9 [Hemicordylus capensis]XP_053157928.1 zinc finger CCHC domain-containing protein 9 [Hemicordylus capensis]XP_053157929.1 zinc finger CCHC domain-containing protein 9 [Hemicordylus capensis]XP_053157930.1 zinc finger CCHC domain-containing protein 9 [Hemicordylus capensis]XP_053157931.1 zinc finger CCHC domain-containing protein 9 [Hemicordylus capensis]
MTRWARASVTHSKKVLDATPWEEMKNDTTGTTATKRRQSFPDRLSVRSTQGKKKNKKKKDYLNEDVNGFMEYLKQNSQMLHNGKVDNSHEAKQEIATALKKDKRREVRRVKRQETKKNSMVCFHCRKPGHGVADCPAVLESQDMGTGICYRCGSTEHEINKCKAKIDPALGEFPYAKCFICGEMGHLSRSCPDNPKGLYAEGGACRICGSVEHFKKDCPENQNLDRAITVGRWTKGMSADYEEILESSDRPKPKPKAAKVVNF